jgi:hypothetical protein
VEVLPEAGCAGNAVGTLVPKLEEEDSSPERNYGSDAWLVERESAAQAGEETDSESASAGGELGEMVYVEEEEGSSQLVQAEAEVEAEEDRIVCD